MPRSEQQIASIVHERIADVFDLDGVNDSTSFVDLGLRSEGVLRLQADLREFLGTDVHLSDLFTAETVADILRAVHRGRTP
ncbi:acyl carrier protein [Microbacterium enclense]|uniref:acyl carrier protein n=1 Tax=Microbacterium enclense TaxID=993073 RepID=UPI003F8082A3